MAALQPGERSNTKMEMMLARALRKKLGLMESVVPKQKVETPPLAPMTETSRADKDKAEAKYNLQRQQSDARVIKEYEVKRPEN